MSTSSDGVLEFLASVHAADEQAARAADDGGDWSVRDPDTRDDPEGAVYSYRAPVAVYVECNPPRGLAEPDAVHIARHDPQSVLARVQAERALVALHRPETLARGIMCAICAEDIEHGSDREGDWPCDTLRALAWGYRGREGFDPAWAPDGARAAR